VIRGGDTSQGPRHESTSRTHRSAAAKREFLRSQGYTKEPKGMIVDHIIPLCAGGADAPSNMQLQTVADAKEKDKWERAICSHHGGGK
jgi:hypothetical protein